MDQQRVSNFYDMVFPSGTSHAAYAELVPEDLEDSRVGDFGCGQSLFIGEFKRRSCNAVFLDISDNVLRGIDYGTRVQASLTDIPMPDGVMDVILCIGVVHHIPAMERAIREIVRTLKPRGKLYLGVYADKTVAAYLRRGFDRAGGRLSRGAIWKLSSLLIWLKNRRNGLRYGSEDHEKRIQDLLVTPVVRYLPARQYTELIGECGADVEEVRRISSMNVLIVRKR